MAATLYEQARALVERSVPAIEFGTLFAMDPTGVQPWPSAEIDQALMLREQIDDLLATANDLELVDAADAARRNDDDLLAQTFDGEMRRRTSGPID